MGENVFIFPKIYNLKSVLTIFVVAQKTNLVKTDFKSEERGNMFRPYPLWYNRPQYVSRLLEKVGEAKIIGLEGLGNQLIECIKHFCPKLQTLDSCTPHRKHPYFS